LPHIRILTHPHNSNLGVGASMNLGVMEAEGDLIAFLDHDDLWHPTKLSEQVKTFDKYPDVGLVYTNVSVIDEDDKELFKIYPNGFRELNKPEELLLKCYITTVSSVMVRRKLFGRIGLFRTDIQSADHDMWLRMIEKAKCFYLPKCLASHRRHLAQISSGRKIWEDGFVILREAYRRYPYGATVKRKRLAVINYRLGQYDWNHKLYWKATKHFLLAAIFDPLRAVDFFISSLFHVGKAN
jgi:glycosyltransferase involved in cell wall biosynthesis